MLFANLKKEVRDLKRLEEIVRMFAKYGFGHIILRLPFRSLTKKLRVRQEVSRLPLGVRLRMCLEELGPTFIKFGQMLSLHPDILPYEICKELEKLQDSVEPIDFSEIKAVLEAEYKRPLDEVFKNFPETPLASASLAQVYEVRIENKEAIVKVQKPDLRARIETDLEIMRFFADLTERYVKEARLYDPKGILEEFRKSILNELDFTNELANIEAFKKNFRYVKNIYFPAVYQDLCSDKVLVIEKIKGIKISDLDKMAKSGLDKKDTARIVTDCLLKQVFTDGFFHADPHPGNIFVLEDGRVSFVDFGIVGRLGRQEKVKLVDIMLAAGDKDIERIIEILRESGALGYADGRKLKIALDQLLAKYYGVPLEEFKVNDFLKDITKAMFENKIRLLPEQFLLIKTLSMLESLDKRLDPALNLTLEIKKLAKKIVREEYSAITVKHKLSRVVRDGFLLIQRLPRDLSALISEIKSGNFKIGFEHINIDNLIAVLDKLSNRLSFSLIIAALIIGSSLLMQSRSQAIFGSSQHLGVAGFIVAATMGLWLVFHIVRYGRL